MRLVTTKAASKDSLQSVPFIVQYESRNNQVHFLGAKIGIISESSKFFATLITLSMGDLNSQIRGVFLNSYGPGHTKFTKSLVYSFLFYTFANKYQLIVVIRRCYGRRRVKPQRRRWYDFCSIKITAIAGYRIYLGM